MRSIHFGKVILFLIFVWLLFQQMLLARFPLTFIGLQLIHFQHFFSHTLFSLFLLSKNLKFSGANHVHKANISHCLKFTWAATTMAKTNKTSSTADCIRATRIAHKKRQRDKKASTAAQPLQLITRRCASPSQKTSFVIGPHS